MRNCIIILLFALLILVACGSGGSVSSDSSGQGSSGGSGSYTLTVTLASSGTVSSSPAGINCGATCSASYVSGTSVTLTASAATGYTFSGWSGACTGMGACTVSMTANRNVTVTFTAVTTAACSTIYASGLTLVTGTDNTAPPTLAKPTKGQTFKDPVYGTCVVRLTDHANEPPVGFARNDYSRRQAFNANDTKILIYSENGFWHLYDAITYAWIKQLSGPGGDAEPQWHPTNPDLLYFVPTNGGLVLNELNVATNQTRVVGNFANRLPWATAAHVWTKSEGSPSADGRYWGFMVDDVNWASLGAFTWDMQTDTILGTMSTNGNRPDNVSISPTGQYIVVSWLDGTWSYTRDFSSRQLVNAVVEHADIALDVNGDDAYVAVDYQTGWTISVNLRTGVRTNLFEVYPNGTATAFHFSGKAYGRPGWVLMSAYADYGAAGRQWLHRKVYAVELKANPRIYHLAHHHVSVYSGLYWDEPHASVNRDFTRIVFNSNWDTGTIDVDTYMIELPAGAIPVN